MSHTIISTKTDLELYKGGGHKEKTNFEGTKRKVDASTEYLHGECSSKAAEVSHSKETDHKNIIIFKLMCQSYKQQCRRKFQILTLLPSTVHCKVISHSEKVKGCKIPTTQREIAVAAPCKGAFSSHGRCMILRKKLHEQKS